ncbi:MAG: TRAP transporter small permease [Pseudomonadota bacterium]
MRRFLDRLAHLAVLLAATCLVTMTAIISYQVVARYGFNASPAWSERLSLVLLAYLVFFGAAAGVRLNFHICILAIRDALPKPLSSLAVAATHVAVAACGIVILLAGYELTSALWGFAIPSLGIPRGLALLPLPCSGLMITLFSVANLAGFGQQTEETSV